MLVDGNLILTASGPTAVSDVTVEVIGAAGLGVAYYWIVTTFPIGNVISGPFQVTRVPTLDPHSPQGNIVRISWAGQPGALEYDVLKTDTATLPAGGNIGMRLHIAPDITTADDVGAPPLPYDLSGLAAGAPVRRGLYLNNRDYQAPLLKFDAAVGVTSILFQDGSIQVSAPGPIDRDAPIDGIAYGRDDADWVPVVHLAGDRMTGPLTLDADPVLPLEAATKSYVDGEITTRLGLDEAPFNDQAYGRFKFGWIPVVQLWGDTMTGPLILAANPIRPLEAATKDYVDLRFTGALHFIGTIDASTGLCTYTTDSGLANGPLIPAASSPNGFLIATTAGTIPSGPAAGIPMQAGDWLLSDGVTWTDIPVGELALTASQIALAPNAFGANNVQSALNNADAQTVKLAGDTMTGPLTATGFSSSNDDQGLFTWGGGRFYKAVGTGQMIRQSSGNQQPQIEDNNGGNRRIILDANNGVRKAGDTMTGGLTISAGGLTINNANLNVRKGDNGSGNGPWAPVFQDAAGRNGVGLVTGYSGNYVGGNPECRLYMWSMVGGWGWHNFMSTTVNSPVQTNWEGALNAPGYNLTSDIAVKQDIEEPTLNDFAQAFAGLRPRKFRRRPLEPAEGQTLESQPGRIEWGLIAQDIESSAPDAMVDLEGIKGYSITDILAIAIGKIRHDDERIQSLEQARLGPTIKRAAKKTGKRIQRPARGTRNMLAGLITTIGRIASALIASVGR